MKFLNRFLQSLRKQPAEQAAPIPQPEPAPEPPKGPELNRWYTYGRHRYYSAGDPTEVIFTNEQKGITRVIVDDLGYIQNFPGVEELERIEKMLEVRPLQPRIRFRTDFSRKEDGIHMLWQIQPDGRYWADDDGFGMEHDTEIYLYSILDDEGRFTMPFRLYEINGERV